MFTLQIRILSNGALSVYGATYFSASPSSHRKFFTFCLFARAKRFPAAEANKNIVHLEKNTLNESRWQTMMSGQIGRKEIRKYKKKSRNYLDGVNE
jgi:hypothetical protein